jgi:TatD DNase family protein
LIDSHAHLEMLESAAIALEEAARAGVKKIISIGVDLSSSRKASILAKKYPNVYHSVGLHPHDAATAAVPGFWREFRQLVEARPPVAIGECGLDYFRNLSAAREQRQVFIRQIEVAREYNLPLVIHDREAHQDVLAIMRDYGAGQTGGVLHCFSGDLDMAQQVLSMGFYLGIAGVITYKKNAGLRSLAAQAPKERLLLETDCPYLAPEPLRGRKNQPAYIRYTAQTLAEAWGLPLPATIAQTTANSERLFNLEAKDHV